MSDDKEIEVVNGNGEELEISQVYEHLEIEKPNMEKKKDIVVPKVKKKEEKEEDKDPTKFILVNASLFGAEQVEKIAQA